MKILPFRKRVRPPQPVGGSLEHFRLLERPVPNPPDWPIPPLTWETWSERAEKTASIDFGCDFDASGICANRRAYAPSPDLQMCCCSGCASAHGYLTAIPPNTAPYYARLFHKVTGFWREGKGCFLPRKFRSRTCLGFHCFSKVNICRYLDTGELVQIENPRKPTA